MFPGTCAVALFSCGCSGAPFTTEEVAGAASGTTLMATSEDATMTPSDGGLTPADALSAVGGDSGGACGPLRSGDAREVCFASPVFIMGSNQPNLGLSFADHTPAHPVTLHSFALDAYEVSLARYSTCVQAGACTLAGSGSQCGAAGASSSTPVLCVTWAQASAFCQWDARRLPTEAEWELAARGADGRTYPWGETFACSRAVVGGYPGGPCGSNASPGPVNANTAGASPELVFNLAGNVAEWVADWVGSYPAAAQADPTGPLAGTAKIVRGGAFSSPLQAAIGYARMPIDPSVAGAWGFRCARDPL